MTCNFFRTHRLLSSSWYRMKYSPLLLRSFSRLWLALPIFWNPFQSFAVPSHCYLSSRQLSHWISCSFRSKKIKAKLPDSSALSFSVWTDQWFSLTVTRFTLRTFLPRFLTRTKRSFSAFQVLPIQTGNFQKSVAFAYDSSKQRANTSEESHYDSNGHACILNKWGLCFDKIFKCKRNLTPHLREGRLWDSRNSWVWWEELSVFGTWFGGYYKIWKWFRIRVINLNVFQNTLILVGFSWEFDKRFYSNDCIFYRLIWIIFIN